MTKQTKLPERTDILKMIERELYEKQREDIKVHVAFVVSLDAGDPVIVNTVVDPHQPFPRWKCKRFVESILERIREMEKEEVAKTEQSLRTVLSSTPIQIPVAEPLAL